MERGGSIEPVPSSEDDHAVAVGFGDSDDSDEETFDPCVIVVDPMDHNGRYFLACLQEWGVEPIVVLSPAVVEAIGDDLSHLAAPREGQEKQWAQDHGIAVESEASGIPPQRPLFGVFSESDAGIETALRLEEAILGNKKPHFGNGRSAVALRWKHETVKAVEQKAGLRAPRQVLASTWDEAREFLVNELGVQPSACKEDTAGGSGGGEEEEEDLQGVKRSRAYNELKAVLKPFRGAASMDVFAVSDLSEAKQGFRAILGSASHGGCEIGENSAVLVQEFLHGDEYAVDTVSLDGEHKVCAVWKYDKRAVNGCKAPTVYYATQLCSLPPLTSGEEASDEDHDDDDTAEAAEAHRALGVAEYVCRALSACGLRDGPAHTEVKWEEGKGAAIVEVNARWHATNFGPLTDACLSDRGRPNALDATVFALLAKAHRQRQQQRKRGRSRSHASEGGSTAEAAEAGRGHEKNDSEAPRKEEEEEEAGAETPSTTTTSDLDLESIVLKAGEAAWRALPPRYGRLARFGRMVHLVSFVSGDLVEVRHLEELETLSSVAEVELSVAVGGSTLVPTVDISATDCGCVRLVHRNSSQVEEDYRRITEDLMPSMFVVD